MGSGVTVCFYLVIGIGVAVAMWLGNGSRGETYPVFRTLTAPFFWPLYVPVLLAKGSTQTGADSFAVSASRASDKADGMATLIVQVETELDAALRSLDGWAEDVLAGEQHRIAELRTAWHQQASHIRELDRLLSQTSVETVATAGGKSDSAEPVDSGEISDTGVGPIAVRNDPAGICESDSGASARPERPGHTFVSMSAHSDLDRDDEEVLSDPVNQSRISKCENSRNENILKLKGVRRQMYDDLLGTLAWVRELVTMIHLAKYTGAPASRALELVQQIAAAVEGVSEVHQYTSRSSN